jgi:HK97 family phage portal protein
VLISNGAPIRVDDRLADISPMLSNPMYFGGFGMQLSGMWAAYAEIYRTQPWVFTLVRKLAASESRLPLKVYGKNGTSREEKPDSAYAQLLRRPNPKLGGKALMRWTRSTRELYGEAIWFKLRDENGQVRELHPIHPTNVIVRRNDSTGVLEYIYTRGTSLAPLLPPFPDSDVVHFKDYNPQTLTRGLSPCEPLRLTLLNEDAARRSDAAMWQNGARPAVVLSHPKSLGKDGLERLKAQWEQVNKGVDKWHGTAVLEEGMTPHVLQVSPDDMQYVQGRQLNREECCGVYDVPPPVVHILDRATFSNITEQMRSMYRDTMAPRLNDDEDVLATQLAPDFVKFDRDATQYAEFNLDEVLRGSYEVRVAANAQAIATGQMTANEARRTENRPDVDGGDQLLVNAALIPLEVVKQVSEPTGSVVEPAPQKVKSLTAQQGSTISGRLGRVTAVDDIDEDAVLAGIPAKSADLVRGLIRAAKSRGTHVRMLRRQIAATIEYPLELTPTVPDDGDAAGIAEEVS